MIVWLVTSADDWQIKHACGSFYGTRTMAEEACSEHERVIRAVVETKAKRRKPR